MVNRESLIASGWTPPPELEDYEPWRPALRVYRDLIQGPSIGSPLDPVDRETIDLLRAVLRAAPRFRVGDIDGFEGMMRILASCPTDKPGTEEDRLGDEIIRSARQWVKSRESRG